MLRIINRVDPWERYKNISSMFRYNSRIVDLVKDQVVVAGYRKDGYVEMKGEMKKEPNIDRDDKPAQLDTLKINMMEEMVARLSSTPNTYLIVMASPKYGATDSDDFAPVKKICNNYGVAFWDYYCSSEFQRMEYFKEPMHLNEKGASVFTECLAARIKSFFAY